MIGRIINDFLSLFYKEYIRFNVRIKFLMGGGKIGNSFFFRNPSCILIGRNVRIKNGARIECYKSFAGENLCPKLIIEDGVNIGPYFTGFIADFVIIKKNTILAGNVSIISENHGVNPELDTPYHAQKIETAPITIGEGCWIGQNVSILPGVEIGDGCVVGANSVVTRSVPSYTISVGSPARVIKKYNFQIHKWIVLE